jgi:23S rRNA (guanosine2251-2'-O)-methyltransferase
MDNFNNFNNNETNSLIIYGKNTVLEAIKSKKEINAVYVQKNAKGIGEHISLAKKSGLMIKEVAVEKLNSLSEQNRHGGIVAALSAVEYVSIEEILNVSQSGEAGSPAVAHRPYILIVDGIEDPHNLGALIRTAEAAGVHGVIIPKRRNVPITGAVYAASAGAAAHMKISRVTNLVDTIKVLKNNNIWVYGAEADGVPYSDVDFSGAGAALVIGSEGQGLGRLVRENCDVIVSVPMFGKINSLNASVCGGILMFKILEGRRAK